MISSTDVRNFVDGVQYSKLRVGNGIVVKWLHTSFNLRKKLKAIFHAVKYKMGQIDKGTRKETETDNKITAFSEYLDILTAIAKLGIYPIKDAARELNFALDNSDCLINKEN